jgi:RNA polymerase sigma factor for flagellar operon FliA
VTLGAIERFDPDRNVKFETYATTRIRGAMIDELRAVSSPKVKPPAP